MVKGCHRRMVVLKCASDSAFESAYFILRNEKERSFSEDEMISQANEIMTKSCFSRKQRGELKRALILAAAFFCGALSASLITALVLLVCY